MKKYPGSDIKYFKKSVEISKKLIGKPKKGSLFSPYSVVPLMSQILGLNAPVSGSGDSPYSIISMIPQMGNNALFREVFDIPLTEKRLIIDELYDMIAPWLLDERGAYISSLLTTKYRKDIRGYSAAKTEILKEALHKKFKILDHFMRSFDYAKGDFAQIVHYGYVEDLHREYSFLESLPKSDLGHWFNFSYPMVNEVLMTNFPDKKTGKTRSIRGWIILITNSTRQLLETGKLRRKKILQAAQLAGKLGTARIGMAGLIASFAEGGYWLSRQLPNIGFTTGHAYTIANIINIMDKCAETVKLDIKKSVIAIVGAGGSIGAGCAKLLMNKDPRHLILIDASSFIGKEKLKKTVSDLKKMRTKSVVSASTDLRDIKKADIVICATNSPSSIIKADYLKKGAIVIDDSFPKNISKSIIRQRKDVIFLEGGNAQLPHSIEVYAARNAPDLMDAPITRIHSCKEIYGCLAELLVLSLTGHNKNYGLGYADPGLAKDILLKSKRFGFSLAPLQCFDQAIDEKQFEEVSMVIKNRTDKRE